MAGVMPRVTHAENDQDWGRPGAKKDIFAAKSLTFKGGRASTDRVLERVENQYWKIEVTDFTAWLLGFYRFVGEWKTTELKPGMVQVDYTYTMYSNAWYLQPINWIFTQVFWRIYMKQVLRNIQHLIENNEPYRHS